MVLLITQNLTTYQRIKMCHRSIKEAHRIIEWIPCSTFTTTRTYFSTNNSPDIDNYNTGDAAWWKLDRAYDGFGNLSQVKKETTGLSAQPTTYAYDPDHGVSLLTVTDPAGFGSGYTYHSTTGLVHTQTDSTYPCSSGSVENWRRLDLLVGVCLKYAGCRFGYAIRTVFALDLQSTLGK